MINFQKGIYALNGCMGFWGNLLHTCGVMCDFWYELWRPLGMGFGLCKSGKNSTVGQKVTSVEKESEKQSKVINRV